MSDLHPAHDDEILFADEDEREEEVEHKETWKVLISDDEEEVHNVTRLMLQNYRFEGRGLTFISAYSAAETKRLVIEHPDTAVVLLDVVMEEDDSGLEMVRYIREEANNKFIRIILRTGQPGKAPEQKVITTYDVNDYKEKTELTDVKLFTSITSALRSYRDLKTIDSSRRGLEQIINSSRDLFKLQSMQNFASGMLKQLVSFLDLEQDSLYVQSDGFAATETSGKYLILAATGNYEEAIGKPVDEIAPEEVKQCLNESSRQGRPIFLRNHFVGHFQAKNDSKNILYVKYQKPLSELDKDLIQVFASNMAVAFDNITLNQEVSDTQRELIFTLGEVVETRSKETANHVRRVGEMCWLMAVKAGLSEEEADLLRLTAPMHDVGKIGIPEAILNKPGKLDTKEFEVIKTHTTIGHDILDTSNLRMLKSAKIIALHHHERWDGSGYPQGLKGGETNLYGRITGLVDVFDALAHKRVYKDAWEEEQIVELFRHQKGKQFDPRLVDLFLDNLDEFIAIQRKYPD